MRFVLRKGGPYYGPRGGKWADAAHTIPWEGEHGSALFHSAPAMHMESIQEHGLRPRKGKGLFSHGAYDAHSQGKVFLADNFSAARNWHGKVGDQLESQHDKTEKHDVVMLRTKGRRTQLDEVGDKDVSGSRYIKKTIEPHELEYFDREHGWRSISRWEPGRHTVPETKDALHAGREAHEIVAERKEAEKSAQEHAAREQKARAAEQAARDKAQQAKTAEWAEKTPEERQAKAKELLEKKGLIPGMSALSRDWQETLGVNERGNLKGAPEDPAKPTTNEKGERVYEVKPPAVLGMHPFQVIVRSFDGDTAHVAFGGGSSTAIPKSSLKDAVRDLHGVVIGKPSEHAPVNAVLDGKAKFLGKGDDGLAFKAGDQVVKVSTTVPYQPGNPGHKTPERAVAVAREQHETVNAMRAAGVPGLMKEQFIEHDGRGYTVRAHAEIPEKLSAEQLSKVHDTIEAMHKKGWVLGDDVQVGLHEGEPVLFDVGKAHKNESTTERERDEDRLQQLYRQHGHEFVPRGASLQKRWEAKRRQVKLLAGLSLATRDKAANELRSLAAGLSKDAPDELERDIIRWDLEDALTKLHEKSAKAMPQGDLNKALKLHRRRMFHGMEISVENQAGSYRRWYDAHAKKEGRTKQLFDYGYIRRTLGTDGDHLDVYVGHNEYAPFVYVVTQMKGPDFQKVDEQKCMLGFDSRQAAEAAYRAHFDDARFFGGIKPVPIHDFKAFVLDKDNHGKLVRSYVVMNRAHEQALPDYESIWGVGNSTPLEGEQTSERRKQSSSRNRGRFSFHGAAAGKPQLRFKQSDFPFAAPAPAAPKLVFRRKD